MSDEDRPAMDGTQPLSGAPSSPSPATAPTPPAPAPNPAYGAPPASGGTVPPPHNPYGSTPRPNPYLAPPPPNPYGAPGPEPGNQPPPNPYPQPGSFDQYVAPNPYGAQPYGGYPAGYGTAVPDHPSATTAMVLGIIGLVGIAFCGGITLVLSPFAWGIGRRAVREIDADPARYGGRDKANAGKIMGIIGTVILALAVLLVIVAILVLVAFGHSDSPGNVFPSSPAGGGVRS